MVGAQMGVPLHHSLCLPAASTLDRVEINAAHWEPAGKRVATVVKAEIGYLGGLERGPPLALPIVKKLALRRAKHEGAHNLLFALYGEESLSRDATQGRRFGPFSCGK